MAQLLWEKPTWLRLWSRLACAAEPAVLPVGRLSAEGQGVRDRPAAGDMGRL